MSTDDSGELGNHSVPGPIENKESAPPSPCISICQLRPADALCIGCLRSIEEIGGWSGYTPEQKRLVMQQVNQRRRAEGRAPI